MEVKFSYLDRQFSDIEPYLRDLSELVQRCEFTLGSALDEFEQHFAEICGVSHAIGVASGTDAIMIALKMLGIGPGDEVITCPTTFIATVGAIAITGALPVFVDSEDGFVIDASQIERAITERTKAIVPIHYTGNVADMPTIGEIANKYNLVVVEDACQAIGASLYEKAAGSWGHAAAFSLHPLKNLNVWGDGGVIVTDSPDLAAKIRRFRNHGLIDRDRVAVFGCNSRLDTLQAVIGNRLMSELPLITERRIAVAKYYDDALAELKGFIRIPTRRPGVRHVFHLYMVRAKNRDQLLHHLLGNGVEAKVHYPIPVHLQEAARHLGYKRGSFPRCEYDSESIITLPAHQHLTAEELEYTVERVRSFYSVSSNQNGIG